MIGLPTTASSRMWSGSSPAWMASSATRSAIAARTTAVISTAPPSWSMANETRLMRSSPKRICGFMTPAEASTSPRSRSAR